MTRPVRPPREVPHELQHHTAVNRTLAGLAVADHTAAVDPMAVVDRTLAALAVADRTLAGQEAAHPMVANGTN